MTKNSKFTATFFMVTALTLGSMTMQALATDIVPNWSPQASEKLVKMPSSYLKRAIDRDFANSSLASALSENVQDIAAKQQSLEDLQDARGMSEGNLKLELDHQYLAEKQAYIKLMGERQAMQRMQAETQIRLYQKMLHKLEKSQLGNTAEEIALASQIKSAQERFKQHSPKVDTSIFTETGLGQSQYAKSYEKNAQAIEKLAQAINQHPMNQSPMLDGEKLSKKEYLNRLIQQEETQLALIQQKDELLSYMAKLVALDAMALADEVEAAQFAENSNWSEPNAPLEPADNIALFLQ